MNVLRIWVLLKLKTCVMIPRLTYAMDLKLMNIMLGLSSHASIHPCPWCDIQRKSLSEKGALRTFGNIQDNFWRWQGHGADRKNARNFFNCIHAPIIFGDKDSKIIDLIPPPELHLLSGTVNTLYDHMVKEWPGASIWPDMCHVMRNALHGGTFDGNSCKKLLQNVDILRSKCPVIALKYVNAFSCFNEVVHSCFGSVLRSNYIELIRKFRDSYLSLGISTTSKVHTIFHHVEDFCGKRQEPLGPFSEQALESLHSDFVPTWQKYKVPPNHPLYSQRLLRSVCEYNASHL